LFLINGKFSNFLKFFYKGWFFDSLYNKLIAKPIFIFSYYALKIIDKGYLEYFGPRGISLLTLYCNNFILTWHKTYLARYLEAMIIFGFLLILISTILQ